MAQFLRPSSDVAAGSWSSTPLWGKVDEASYDDADYISGPSRASSTCQLGLSSVVDPVSSSGHILRVRAYLSNTGLTCTFALYQGATLIKSWDPGVTTGSFASYNVTLTAGEADSITNYGDLRFHCIQTYSSGTGTRRAYVSWVEMEVPDIPPTTVSLNAATLASSAQAVSISAPPPPVTVNLNAATLSSSAQAIVPLPGPVVVSLASTTLTASPQYLRYLGKIFDINHETGDLTQYDSSVIDEGKLSVTTDAAIVGNYGLSVAADDADDKYGKKIVVPYTTLRQRIYIDIHSIDTFGPGITFHKVVESDSPNYSVIQFMMGESSSIISIFALVFDNNGNLAYSDSIPVSTGVSCIEYELISASAPEAGDGYFEWWVDGSSVTSESTITNYALMHCASWDMYYGALGVVDAIATYDLDEFVANNTGQEIGQLPYNQKVNLSSAAISASASSITSVPGEVSVAINTVSLAALAQVTSIDAAAPDITVNLNAASLSASPQSITAPPGEVSVSLNTPTLASSAGQITTESAIPLSAAIITASPGQTSIFSEVAVVLNAASIQASPQGATVIPGDVASELGQVTIEASPQTTSIFSEVTVQLNAAVISASAETTDIFSEVSVVLNSAVINADPQASSIFSEVTVPLASASIMADPQATSVEAASNEIIIELSSATLSSSPGSISVQSVNKRVQVSWVEFRIPDAGIQVQLVSAVISAIAETITPVAGDVIVPLGSATISADAQATSIYSEELPTTVELQTAQLASSAPSVDVQVGEVIVSLNSAVLGSSASSISVTSDSLAILSAAEIAAVPQAVSVIAGEAVVALNSAVVFANAGSISTSGETVVSLSSAVIASSAEALSVVSITEIQLASAVITADPQDISSIGGEVVVPLSAATLSAIPQSITEFAETFIALSSAVIGSSAGSVTVIPGDASVALSSAVIASSSTINVIPGPVTLQLSTTEISTVALSIQEVPGEAAVSLHAALIAISAQLTTIDRQFVERIIIEGTLYVYRSADKEASYNSYRQFDNAIGKRLIDTSLVVKDSLDTSLNLSKMLIEIDLVVTDNPSVI